MGDASPAKSAKFNILKDREYERIKERLQDEFQEIDKNHDGKITVDEIIAFLKHKSNGQPVDEVPVEQLFMALDENGDGRIELNEFVEAYFLKQVEDEMRLKELEEMVIEDSEKLEEIKVRLEQVRESEQLNQYGIMEGSPFSVTLVEARDLPKST
jgi:hypothetical protein